MSPTFAHTAGWFGDPAALVGLTLFAFVYFAAVQSARGSVGGWRIASFSFGLVALFIATSTPLESSVGSSLPAHMVQHMLLISVAAPLVAVGLSPVRLASALAPRLRSAMNRLNRWVFRRPAAAGLLAVGLALLHTVVLWAWHVPPLYEAALASGWLHALEHLSFFATALLSWLVVFRFGAAIPASLLAPAVLFGLAAQGAALGALMAFAGGGWYPVYGSGAEAMADQQLAGLIMWGFGGAAPAVAASVLAIAWIERSRRFPARPDLLTGPGRGGRR